MPDNKRIIAPRDRVFINLAQDYEVDFWTDKFGCTRSELERAVKTVGNRADDVRDYLRGI